MDEHGEWLAQRFEEHRARLRAVAYRMLGSTSEAEDAVQEAWLRLSRSDTRGVENLGGWLTTVVASPAAGPFHQHGGHLATHATDFLSSLVHEGVADFMSRSGHRCAPLTRRAGGLDGGPGALGRLHPHHAHPRLPQGLHRARDGQQALVADSVETWVCAYLSITLLAALGLN